MPGDHVPAALPQVLEIHEERIQRLEDGHAAQRELTAGLKVEVASCTEAVREMGGRVSKLPADVMAGMKPLVDSNAAQEAILQELKAKEDARTEAGKKRADWAGRWKTLAFTVAAAGGGALVKYLIDLLAK